MCQAGDWLGRGSWAMAEQMWSGMRRRVVGRADVASWKRVAAIGERREEVTGPSQHNYCILANMLARERNEQAPTVLYWADSVNKMKG